MNKICSTWLGCALAAAALGSSPSDRGLTFINPSEAGEFVTRWDFNDRAEVLVVGNLSVIFNSQADPRTRLNLIHSLGNELSPTQIKQIYQFLKLRTDLGEKNLPALQAVKNDLINLLLEQTLPPLGLANTLIEVYQDHEQDGVTRDYAVQHLITAYEQGAVPSAEDKARIRTELWEIAQTETSMAGTALLGLHRLALNDPTFNRDKIKQRALEMVLAATTSATTRMTAIQVCAEAGASAALSLIRSLTQSESSLSLRVSALSALGQLGDEQDLVLLEQLNVTCPDSGLHAAIHQSLKQLQERIHPQKLALNQN